MNEWVWRNGGMILTGENWSTGRETLPVSLRLPKIVHLLYLEWNQILFCDRPTTTCTMHGSLRFEYLKIVFRRILLFAESNCCSSRPSVRPSAHLRVPHWTDLREIWYWGLFVKMYHWIPNCSWNVTEISDSLPEDLHTLYSLWRH